VASNICISIAGHFDGHGSAMVQYRMHQPMEEVQGFYKRHLKPPSDNYSLCIAPAAARATANKTMMQNVSTLLTS